jgi:subtilisin family serine protease
VSATDKGITSFFGSGNRFSGTSAATPHAAAVGALQLAANPALTRDQIEAAQKATARPVGAFGPLAMGAGLIDAQAAITSQPPSAPTVTFTSGPTGTTNTATPTFTFSAGPHPKTVNCAVDGGVAQACVDSYAPGPLADGAHTVAVTATDYFGQSTTATQAFTVATVPDTLITKAPKDKIYTKRTKYQFVSNIASATFQCKVDRSNWQACQTGVRVVHIRYGRHQFLVRAVNGSTVDPTPASDTFKRKHKHGR